MKVIDPKIELLIVSYLDNNLSKHEEVELWGWVNSSIENKQLFESYLTVWKSSENAKNACMIDVECDWQNVKEKIFKPKTRALFPFWLSAAAAVTGAILIVGVSLFSGKLNGQTIRCVADNGVKTVLLPDSSRVILNRDAVIEYAADFNSGHREVNLKGEAFFKVTHLANADFKVVTRVGSVKVLGTRFSVNLPDNSKVLEVKVESGRVLMSAEEKSVILAMGEMATAEDGQINKNDSFNPKDLCWKSSKIVFKSASLLEIVQQLNTSYSQFDDYQILAADTTTRVTTTFENQSFEEVLQELSTHFGRKFVLNKRTLVISN